MNVQMTEALFQEQVVELARILGWRTCHVRRTIGRGRRWTTATSVVGWPDLTLYHPARGRFLMRELKTDTGRVTDEQAQVLSDLRDSGIDADVWRPTDWDAIQRALTEGATS